MHIWQAYYYLLLISNTGILIPSTYLQGIPTSFSCFSRMVDGSYICINLLLPTDTRHTHTHFWSALTLCVYILECVSVWGCVCVRVCVSVCVCVCVCVCVREGVSRHGCVWLFVYKYKCSHWLSIHLLSTSYKLTVHDMCLTECKTWTMASSDQEPEMPIAAEIDGLEQVFLFLLWCVHTLLRWKIEAFCRLSFYLLS